MRFNRTYQISLVILFEKMGEKSEFLFSISKIQHKKLNMSKKSFISFFFLTFHSRSSVLECFHRDLLTLARKSDGSPHPREEEDRGKKRSPRVHLQNCTSVITQQSLTPFLSQFMNTFAKLSHFSVFNKSNFEFSRRKKV